MLKRLRHKFVIIVMTLVGAVLIAVLGSTYVSTVHSQRQLIDNALERSIRRGTEARVTIGYEEPPREIVTDDLKRDERAPIKGEKSDMRGMADMLGLVIDIDGTGIIVQTSDSPVVVNTEVMYDVINLVVVDGETSGDSRENHIAWKSTELADGGYRIAIVDTTGSETLLSEMAASDIKIIAIALAVLFAISWWLSDWALRPVAAAWNATSFFGTDSALMTDTLSRPSSIFASGAKR